MTPVEAAVVQESSVVDQLDDPLERSSVGDQARWAYGLAGLGNLMALAWLWMPGAADSFGFVGADGHPVRAVLPVLIMFGLWLGFALGAVVPAIRLGRLARWAAIDEAAAPVSAFYARLMMWSVLGLVAISAGIIGFSLI